jgi:hypothetical protein
LDEPERRRLTAAMATLKPARTPETRIPDVDGLIVKRPR